MNMSIGSRILMYLSRLSTKCGSMIISLISACFSLWFVLPLTTKSCWDTSPFRTSSAARNDKKTTENCTPMCWRYLNKIVQFPSSQCSSQRCPRNMMILKKKETTSLQLFVKSSKSSKGYPSGYPPVDFLAAKISLTRRFNP